MPKNKQISMGIEPKASMNLGFSFAIKLKSYPHFNSNFTRFKWSNLIIERRETMKGKKVTFIQFFFLQPLPYNHCYYYLIHI